MSIVFSDTTNKNGLVQNFEDELGFDDAAVSGSPTRLKKFASAASRALDRFKILSIAASGKWQADDSNHDDYPVVFFNIESGKREYAFLEDEDGNLILDIHRVMVIRSSDGTVYEDLDPVDMQSDRQSKVAPIIDGTNPTGAPTAYDKTANGIIFDFTPDYSKALGGKLFIDREPSYFVYTDTTKKPGVPGIFHAYFYLLPARDEARRKDMDQYPRLRDDVAEMEKQITAYYARRDRDRHSRPTLKPRWGTGA